LKGRAGTGKTITLLQAAIAKSEWASCVVLTYNLALLGDIRRLIKYRSITVGTRTNNIKTNSTQGFFCYLMNEYGIDTTLDDSAIDFNRRYEEGLKRLSEMVETCAKRKEYLFIDEAQDWMEIEQEVLFKLYPPQNIIIADGVDQFIRSTGANGWRNIEGSKKIERRTNLRQKTNLVDFINCYAEECGVDWEMESCLNLVGGEVIITNHYNEDVHNMLSETCKEHGCTNYDMLYLAPPTLGAKQVDKFINRMRTYCGVNFFDGTKPSNRHVVPMSDDECRMFQYESCRGLEGWCTVCIDFDRLIEQKKKLYCQDNDEQVAFKQAVLWSLMPLTRAVDTLVIGLKNPQSEIGKILWRVAQTRDFVKWAIED
jgi:hypothetical protein